MSGDESDLFEKLKRYADSDMYPFHMPGHKRRSGPVRDPYALDITEVEGFDNLHHPEGILKDSMERAAAIYGADKTYYLVNGSSSGILAAVSTVVPFGGKLVLARNSHRSTYNAVVLNHLKTAMTYPQKVDKLGIFGGISPEDVDNILLCNTDAAAVLLVSPTYDGVISDIASVAEVVHSRGIPLIVDEAHGAHLKFTSGYKSALDCGADLVVQSLHKTLPSLTQTAILHVKGGRVDIERLEYYLQVFQSSSPSYILLGSIEACIRGSAAHSPGEWDAHYDRIASFRESLGGLSAITLPGREKIRGLNGIRDYDDSRLIISVRDCILRGESSGKPAQRVADGRWLCDVLRQRFHLEMEMAADTYALAITTPFDTDEGLGRLADALLGIDRELERIHEPIKRRNHAGSAAEGGLNQPPALPEAVLTAAEALDAECEAVPVSGSEGRVAAEFAYFYPPGIPLIVPGERIGEETLCTLAEWRKKGLLPQGMADKTARTVRVVKK